MVKNSPVGISVVSAIICHFRNKHMTLLHHIVSQILDRGGATDETIATLNKLGLCVSPSAAAKKKKKTKNYRKGR